MTQEGSEVLILEQGGQTQETRCVSAADPGHQYGQMLLLDHPGLGRMED